MVRSGMAAGVCVWWWGGGGGLLAARALNSGVFTHASPAHPLSHTNFARFLGFMVLLVLLAVTVPASETDVAEA